MRRGDASLPVALLLLLVQLLLLSSFSDAFVHISGVYHTSVSSSARSSSAASSSLQSSSAQSSSAFSSSPVSSSLLPSSAAASSSALSSSSSSAAADSSDDLSSSTGVASATSDPRLVGWWGQSFYVSGAVGGVYNLLSDRSVQLNAYVVQLQHIRCPVLDGRAMQRCFDEQGTYFGVLAIALRTGEGELQHVRMTGGAYDVGFHSVTVTVTVGDMQQRHELQVGEQYDGVAAAVTRVASSATVTTSNDSTPTSASADWRLHPTLSVQLPPSLSSSPLHHHIDEHRFAFTHIFPPNTSPPTLHSTLTLPLLHSFTSGLNSSLLTLGPLSSGKTLTLTGGPAYVDRGLVPRAIEWVLEEGERQRGEWAWELSMSHVEVYHEALTDLLLLAPVKGGEGRELSVREDEGGVISVKNLSRLPVTSAKQAMAVYAQSMARRRTAAHPLNPSSSRSHSLFTLHLARRHLHSSRERVVHSKLHMVDLAGVERLGKNPQSSASSPALLREAVWINRSLSYLEQVVVALTAKGGGGGGVKMGGGDFVPWRQCKLTLLLKDCIVGGGRCAVLACVGSEVTGVEDVVGVCKMVGRMQRVEGKLRVNVELDPKLMAERRGKEVEELKEELRMYDELRGGGKEGGGRYGEPYSAREVEEVRAEVMRYVRGEVADIECDSMRKVREAFRQMKAVINAASLTPALDLPPSSSSSPITTTLANPATAPATQRTAAPPPATLTAAQPPEAADDPSRTARGGATSRAVSVSRDSSKRAEGKPPPFAPSPQSVPTEKEVEAAKLLAEAEAEAAKKVTTIITDTPAEPSQPPTSSPPPPLAPASVLPPLVDGELPSEAVAFVHFKAGVGKDVWTAYVEVAGEYGRVRGEWKRVVGGMVEEREWLVSHRREAWSMMGKEAGAGGAIGGVMSEADYNEWVLWRERKRRYREAEGERRRLEGEVEGLRRRLEEAQRRVVDGFKVWYGEVVGRVEGDGGGGRKEGGRRRRGREGRKAWWEEGEESGGGERVGKEGEEEKEASPVQSLGDVEPLQVVVDASATVRVAGKEAASTSRGKPVQGKGAG